MENAKAKMSPETKEKGRVFVEALLDEGRDYREMLSCLRAVLTPAALKRNGDNARRTALALDVTIPAIRKWLKDDAGIERTVVLKESA